MIGPFFNVGLLYHPSLSRKYIPPHLRAVALPALSIYHRGAHILQNALRTIGHWPTGCREIYLLQWNAPVPRGDRAQMLHRES